MSDGITEARRGTYFQNDKYIRNINDKPMETPQTITFCTGIGLNMFFPEYITIEITPEAEGE